MTMREHLISHHAVDWTADMFEENDIATQRQFHRDDHAADPPPEFMKDHTFEDRSFDQAIVDKANAQRTADRRQ